MASLARHPATSSELSAAYRAAAQRELQRTRTGAVIVGHKVGYTNIGAWQRLGATEPMWGAMYDDTVIQIGRAGGTCSLAPFVGPRIEPEIVLHFGKTPSLQATLEDVLDCVDWMAQGFEIVLTPADGVPPTVPEAISMGGMHGALLVGHPRPVAELGPDLRARLEAVQLALYCDGRLKEQGAGSNVLGNPLNSVLHLMQGLAREGRPPLQAGSIVTTGTLTAAFPIAAGERWTTRLTGLDLPDLDVRFE